MSIISIVLGQDGIVMGADSRLTKKDTHDLMSDQINKLFLIHHNRIGIASTGSYSVNKMHIPDFIYHFENDVLEENDTLKDVSNKLLKELKKDKSKDPPVFYIAGYQDGRQYMYEVTRTKVIPQNFSMLWSGNHPYVDHLMENHGINFSDIYLHDAIRLVKLVIQVEIEMEYFSNQKALCGGPIDILTITKSGGQWHCHK